MMSVAVVVVLKKWLADGLSFKDVPDDDARECLVLLSMHLSVKCDDVIFGSCFVLILLG